MAALADGIKHFAGAILLNDARSEENIALNKRRIRGYREKLNNDDDDDAGGGGVGDDDG